MLTFLVILLSILTYYFWLPNGLEIDRKKVLSSKEGWTYIVIIGISFLTAFILKWFDPIFLPWFISLIVLGIIDIKHQSVRIMDLIISSMLVLPLVNWSTLMMSIGLITIIIMVLLGLKWVLKKVYGQNAFGGADIWIITSILIAFEGALSLVAIYSAIISSAIIGIVLMIFFKRSRRSYIPFIPFLTFGVFLTLIKGPFLLNQYMQLINN